MMFKYIKFSVSISVISWIVGMIINAFLKKTEFYTKHLSNLNFIKSKFLNNIIGIFVFKWIVKNTPFKFFNQKLTVKKKIEKSDLISLRNDMTASEIDHLIGFAFVTVFAIVKFVDFNFLFGLMIMLANIMLNLYPSLLQQENKRRIDRLLKKI